MPCLMRAQGRSLSQEPGEQQTELDFGSGSDSGLEFAFAGLQNEETQGERRSQAQSGPGGLGAELELVPLSVHDPALVRVREAHQQQHLHLREQY